MSKNLTCVWPSITFSAPEGKASGGEKGEMRMGPVHDREIERRERK